MAKCAAVTKRGEPCRREAVADSAFCQVHQQHAGEAATTTVETPPSPVTGASTETVTADKPLRVRYKGSGVYIIGRLRFSKTGEVVEVEPWMHAHLTKLLRFEDAT